MMRLEMMRKALGLLRRGGRMVSFGEPNSRSELYRIIGLTLCANLPGSGKSLSLYGTSSYFLFNPKPYLEDWAALFRLLGDGKINPVIRCQGLREQRQLGCTAYETRTPCTVQTIHQP